MWEDLYNRIKRNCVIDPVTNCHIWQGQTDGREDPYGRVTHKGHTLATHIGVAKAILHRQGKKLPKGKQVDHRCTVRLCCNEDHLQVVTNLRNQRLKRKRAKHKGDVFRCLAVK